MFHAIQLVICVSEDKLWAVNQNHISFTVLSAVVHSTTAILNKHLLSLAASSLLSAQQSPHFVFSRPHQGSPMGVVASVLDLSPSSEHKAVVSRGVIFKLRNGTRRLL